MKNICAIILLMMCCWSNSQAVSKKELKQLNMNVDGYELKPFIGNFAVVKNDRDRYGLVDKNGQLVYPFEYDTITTSSEYINLLKNNKSVLLNASGEFLADSTQFSEVRLEGDLAHIVNLEGKHGYCNKNLEPLVPCTFKENDLIFFPLANNDCILALRSQEDGKWGFLYPKTMWESGFIYEGAPIQIGDNFLFVTRHGMRSVFDCTALKDIMPYKENVRSCYFWNKGISFYIAMNPKDSLDYIYNSDGKVVTAVPEKEYCLWKNKYVVLSKGGENRNVPLKMLSRIGKQVHILKVTDKLCWQYKNDKWTFKTTDGKRLSDPFEEFAFMEQGDEEAAFIVGRNGQYGVINMKGKEIVPIQYSLVKFHPSGNIKVYDEYNKADSTKNRFVFFNKAGKQLKGEPMVFDPYMDSTSVIATPEEIVAAGSMWMKNAEGKYGLFRIKDMKKLIPFVCDECGTLMKNGMAIARYGDREYYINEKGEGLPMDAYAK